MLPGLVDAHGHLMYLARGRLSFDVRGLASEEEIARRVGERAARAAAAASGSPGAAGTRTSGPAARSHPRLARPGGARASGGAGAHRRPRHVGNSAALAAVGIDPRHAATRAGGLIVRDARGEPTGLLIDTAQSLLQAAEPRPSDEQFDAAVRECHRRMPGRSASPASTRWAPSSTRSPRTGGWSSAGDFPFRNYAAVAGRSDSTWVVLSRARPRDDRRDGRRDGRRAEAPGRRRARLARRRAPRPLLRRSRATPAWC